MTTEQDIDPETLQSELEQIKEAMGLQERYPSAFQLWLLYGALGVFASFGSQAVVTFELSSWGHAVSWGGFYTLGYLYEWFALDSYETTNAETKPNVRAQIAGVVGLLVATVAITSPFLGELTAVESQAMLFALIIAAIGAIYIVQAASLKSYRIRARDRYAFYLGGLWMLVYGVAMANVGVLQEWGYAIFGILFAVHGLISYLVLRK